MLAHFSLIANVGIINSGGIMKTHKHFSTAMSIDEILEIMDKNDGITEVMYAGPCFLQFKLHEQLQNEQAQYNAKQLFWSRSLAIATWILVIATLLLVVLE